MTTEAIFEAWAPTGARWSAWAKPVLFSCLPTATLPEPPALLGRPERALLEVPAAADDLALVLDLPGAEGVFTGLALAQGGYRPVPLYNAVPLPTDGLPSEREGVTLVDVMPILAALARLAPTVAGCSLRAEAPPAFLLDAHRRHGSHPASPLAFDNRSVAFTTDFPSADRLLAHGIRRVWLIQAENTAPQADLANTLRAWQAAGIALWLKPLAPNTPARPLMLRPPSWLRALGHELLVLVGLRRQPLGGFNGVLSAPVTTSTPRSAQSAG